MFYQKLYTIVETFAMRVRDKDWPEKVAVFLVILLIFNNL